MCNIGKVHIREKFICHQRRVLERYRALSLDDNFPFRLGIVTR